MRAARIDANQTAIVQALRAVGWSVQPLHTVGDGCPDLLVGGKRHGGLWCMVLEVKDGSKPPSARRLTPDQQKWHAAWKGPIAIVENVEQALEAIK